jgi:hypothetical protein
MWSTSLAFEGADSIVIKGFHMLFRQSVAGRNADIGRSESADMAPLRQEGH